MASTPTPPAESMGRAQLTPVSAASLPSGEVESFPESAYSSPGSTHLSPASPADHLRDSFRDNNGGGSTGPSDLDPASGPQRSRSASHSGNGAGSSEPKEKRKRSRVTPEQLAHLERLFAADRSPTAARRKEISDMLGMQERQTQIWFQNRRAKAKLLESRKEHGDGEGAAAPPLVAGSDAELFYLVHEDDPINVIPCVELSIGTWKRVVSGPGNFDLVAYTCESQKRLTWFIYSAGQGFKMEVPFSTILDTTFSSAGTAGMGQASFMLSQPPLFYLEHVVTTADPMLGPTPVKTWKRCSDWTEGMQATSVLQHELVGAAVQLAHVLRNISAYSAGPSIPLYPPIYHTPGGTPHVSPTDAGSVAGIAEHNGPDVGSAPQTPHFAYIDYSSAKRRFSTPALMQPHATRHFPTGAVGYAEGMGDSGGGGGADDGRMVNGNESGKVGSSRGMSPDPTYTDLSGSTHARFVTGLQPGAGMPSFADDLPRLPIAQTISRRSFAAPSSSPSYPDVHSTHAHTPLPMRHSISGPFAGCGAPRTPHALLPPGVQQHSLASLNDQLEIRRTSSAGWDPAQAGMPTRARRTPDEQSGGVLASNGGHGGMPLPFPPNPGEYP